MARFTLPKNALLFCRWREVKTLGSRDCPLRPVRFVTPATVAGDGVAMPRNRHGVSGAICTRSAQCGAVSGVDGLPLHPWAARLVGTVAPLSFPLTPILYHNDTQKSTLFSKIFLIDLDVRRLNIQQTKRGEKSPQMFARIASNSSFDFSSSLAMIAFFTLFHCKNSCRSACASFLCASRSSLSSNQ